MSMYDDEREQQQEESDGLSTARNIKNTIDRYRNNKEEQHNPRNDFKDDTNHGEKAQADYNATESDISNSAQRTSPSSTQSSETGKNVDTVLGLANTDKMAGESNNFNETGNNGTSFNNSSNAPRISGNSLPAGENTATNGLTESGSSVISGNSTSAVIGNAAANIEGNVAANAASSAVADIAATTAVGTTGGGPIGAAIGAGIGVLVAAKDKVGKVIAVIAFILVFIPMVIISSLPTASIFNVFGWNGIDDVEIAEEDRSETIREEFDKISAKISNALSKKQEERISEIKVLLSGKFGDLSSEERKAAVEKSIEKMTAADADADTVDIVTIVAAYSVSLGNADSELNVKDMVKKIKKQSYIDFYNFNIGTTRHKEKIGEKEVSTENTTYTKVKYYTYKPTQNKQNISYHDENGNQKTVSFYEIDQEKWTVGTANDTVYVSEYVYKTITMYDQYGNARTQMSGYVPTGTVVAISSKQETQTITTTENEYVYWYDVTLKPFNMSGIYRAFGILNPNGKYYEKYYTKSFDNEGNSVYDEESVDSGMTYSEAIEYYAENYYEILFGDDEGYNGDVVIDTSATADIKVDGFICPLPYEKKVTISSPYQPDGRTDVSTGKPHMGIDMCVVGGTSGKTVVATAAGKVVTSEFNGYGNYISIEHTFVDSNGTTTKYYSVYGHLQSRSVTAGTTVKQGQTIGLAGNTYGPGGYSTGAHLHFEIRKGTNNRNYGVDPEILICSGQDDKYLVKHYHCSSN